MDNRGQTTFEYLLLVGGVVILAVIIIYLMTTGMQASSHEVNRTVTQTTNTLITEANSFAEGISSGLSP